MKDLKKELQKRLLLKNEKKSASKPISGEDAGPKPKPAEVPETAKISPWRARKDKLLAKKMIKPQESKITLTNGPFRACQEYVVNKDELSKKYTDLKIKPLGSKTDSNLISNTDLEEIDEYFDDR